MKILILDNYDSFTYNLVHIVKELGGHHVEVHRNDAISLPDVANFDKIILSPGPGVPSEAGILLPLIKTYAQQKPILGICLGHQAIGEAFGAKLIRLANVFHGVASSIRITAHHHIFQNLGTDITVGRYHSWVVSQENFPDELEITAVDGNHQIMALRHRTLNVHGVQFHPESVLTNCGKDIIANFLNENNQQTLL